jgi:hypothetical protein
MRVSRHQKEFMLWLSSKGQQLVYAPLQITVVCMYTDRRDGEEVSEKI